MIGYVYCLKSGPDIIYIGSTINPHTRLISHRTDCQRIYTPLYEYIRNNNIKFEMEILEEVVYKNKSQLREMEAKWIKEITSRGHTLHNVFYTAKTRYGGMAVKDKWINIKLDREVISEAKKICADDGIRLCDYIAGAVRRQNNAKNANTLFKNGGEVTLKEYLTQRAEARAKNMK